ncbi:unnamed protein product [Leptidea sinapis]|uniref:Uncharacterized protein n=1 Tax=Leptidea sinapis TaxID=189913 RepID=A0A5E4R1F3_9NEOP|nr:unnamed protein product [Leptidea sinapis]
MEAQDKSELSERLQNILNNLTKCKFNYINGSNECSTLREINIKLESELKETRELEKSHRYQLLTSREMIANLQETVSHLAYLKRDIQADSDTHVAQLTNLIEELRSKQKDMEREHRDQKLKEVEEKLKQSQFKEYLAQSTCPSQYENKVERPYSVEPNSSYSVETSAFGNQTSQMPINKGPAQNTLQVMYYDGKTRKNDKKSSFNITKKRKLYSGERLD